MLTTSKWRAAAVAVLTIAVLNLGFVSAAQAGIVNTGALVQTGRDASLASIRGQLDRAEARAQMEKMGVDAADVDARLAALSDSELQELAKKMQEAPAGGDALGPMLNEGRGDAAFVDPGFVQAKRCVGRGGPTGAETQKTMP